MKLITFMTNNNQFFEIQCFLIQIWITHEKAAAGALYD